MLPVALKNAMKSYRYGSEGVLTKNNDVIHPEDVTGVELFSQAIRFSPRLSEPPTRGGLLIFQYRTKLEDHRSRDLCTNGLLLGRMMIVTA